MCGLISLFAEHANVRFAAGFDFEALNFRTQTIVADSIECFTQAVLANHAAAWIFLKAFVHIRKAAEERRREIIVNELAHLFGFFFLILKTFSVKAPADSAASTDKIAVELRELFFAQVCVAVAQLLVFCRVFKLAVFARLRIDELVKFFGGDSEHCELSSHSWKRPSRFALIPLSTFPPTTQGVIFKFIFPTQIKKTVPDYKSDTVTELQI